MVEETSKTGDREGAAIPGDLPGVPDQIFQIRTEITRARLHTRFFTYLLWPLAASLGLVGVWFVTVGGQQPLGIGLASIGALIFTALGLETARKGQMLSSWMDTAEKLDSEMDRRRGMTSVLETVDQGVAVYDKDLRLTIWNQRFVDLLDLPPQWVEQGITMESLIRFNISRGEYGADDSDIVLEERLAFYKEGMTAKPHKYERRRPDGSIIEISGKPLEGGGLVTTYSDITERSQHAEEMERQALRDNLTGLGNRRSFRRSLEQAIELSDRTEQSLTVLFLDLDFFKDVNDSYGHLIGDILLQEIGRRLKACARGNDEIARLGGDEFALLGLNGHSYDGAVAVAERIIEAVSQPVVTEDLTLHIGTSIGISVYPEDAETADQLLTNADIALYRAKGNGRNCFAVFDHQMHEQVVDRKAMEVEIRNAHENGEFALFFQPQLDVKTGGVVGAEVLLRWISPERGMVSPGDFIPVAESSGLIIPITEWILVEACKKAKEWRETFNPDFRISVNLSPQHFKDDSIEKLVSQIISEAELAPDAIELEITEGMVMPNADFACEILGRLRDIGVHVAVDDFGIGYSSMHYLKSFPVNRLKIDQSFVRDCVKKREDGKIVEGIISLAHSLNLEITAEGVETREQELFLRKHNCDVVQGFLYARPLAEPDFEAYLRDIESHRPIDTVVGK